MRYGDSSPTAQNDKFDRAALTAAGDGRDDGQLVALGNGGGLLGRQVADVVIVEVDVDERPQLAFGGVEVLAQLGIGGDQLAQCVADGGPGNIDCGLTAGVRAQRRWNVDLHTCSFSIAISIGSSMNCLSSSPVPV